MSIKAVRKHLVTVTYTDYGSHLATVWRTASSIDDSEPISDGNEFARKDECESYLAKWLRSEAADAARANMGWAVERGPDLERSVDMNPHGLI